MARVFIWYCCCSYWGKGGGCKLVYEAWMTGRLWCNAMFCMVTTSLPVSHYPYPPLMRRESGWGGMRLTIAFKLSAITIREGKNTDGLAVNVAIVLFEWCTYCCADLYRKLHHHLSGSFTCGLPSPSHLSQLMSENLPSAVVQEFLISWVKCLIGHTSEHINQKLKYCENV